MTAVGSTGTGAGEQLRVRRFAPSCVPSHREAFRNRPFGFFIAERGFQRHAKLDWTKLQQFSDFGEVLRVERLPVDVDCLVIEVGQLTGWKCWGDAACVCRI
jgi:hypothetical protein